MHIMVHHNALDDAKSQANHLIKIWRDGEMTKKDPKRQGDYLRIQTTENTRERAFEVHADLDSRIAIHLRHAVMDELAHGAGMDVRTFRDFLQFLSEDSEIQSRFTGWRAKRRLLD